VHHAGGVEVGHRVRTRARIERETCTRLHELLCEGRSDHQDRQIRLPDRIRLAVREQPADVAELRTIRVERCVAREPHDDADRTRAAPRR
jgi:hypothetical protein